jgi:murein DD-endopeptidase MepM/ murein hydrolase activator NlpD
MALLTGCGGGHLPRQVVHGGVHHHVRRGQTLWSIARKYGVDLQTIVRANRLSNTAILHVGQKLYIPGATRRRQVTSRCPCGPNDSTPAQNRASTSESSRPTSQSSAKHGKKAVRQSAFIWPIQGTVTRDFKRRGKRRHDGVDIAASKGAPIRAAADGKVIYSDWGPGGYGRIVILQHGADIVTVYAHNHRNLVQVGQSVRQGDYVATVGKSGRASGYHLHFELRRKTVPVSPFKFLSDSQQIARLNRR